MPSFGCKVWCTVKEKWQLRLIGRSNVYNLLGSTLDVLQVCDCKKCLLGRNYGLEFCGGM